jgi:hypothetical protein
MGDSMKLTRHVSALFWSHMVTISGNKRTAWYEALRDLVVWLLPLSKTWLRAL